MEQHGPGRVKYLHDLTATHVDADHTRKVLLFLPRLPQHIPIRQRSSLNLELIASSATEAERQRGETDFRPFYYSYQYPSALKASRPQEAGDISN